MDYWCLFQESDTFVSKNLVCTCFRQRSAGYLIHNTAYLMLFVLDGSVSLAYKGVANQTLLPGEMLIVNRQRISQVWCQSETILMEYALPEDLTTRFKQHPTCFAQLRLPVVPITGRLETWVEQLFQPRLNDVRSQDNGLLALLVKYQKHRLKAIGAIIKEYLVQKELCRKQKIADNNLQGIEYELPKLI